jgi:hypothetical protein
VRSTGGDIDPGPIRDLLREHILQTTAVDLGDMVLGQEVTERRIHSAYSLFIATTLHLKRHRKKSLSGLELPRTIVATSPTTVWYFPLPIQNGFAVTLCLLFLSLIGRERSAAPGRRQRAYATAAQLIPSRRRAAVSA